jgi:hypothetical protein
MRINFSASADSKSALVFSGVFHVMNSRIARILFVLSIILNLALLGEALRLERRVIVQAAAPPAHPAEAADRPTAPFRWSQLEAKDYPTYIANLRAIGCPEQTIREIVVADVDDLYAPRRGALLAKIAGGGAPDEINQVQSALARLRLEENAMFRRVFGIPDPVDALAPAMAQAVSAPARARDFRPAPEETNASMPLVFQQVDTSRLQLTAEQQQSLDDVRQSFLAQLGTNLDVNSPEYLRRWQAAQKQADNLMGAFIGRQAELEYQDAVQSQPPAVNAEPAGN